MPVRVDGHPALSRLVTVPVDEFASRVWGREPLLSSAVDLGGRFDDLLSPSAVDELVSQRGLRTPFLRVAKGGTTYPDAQFTDGGGVGAAVADQISDDKLLRLFADGATMVLQGLHRTWPAVTAFSQQLAADLGHPVQANAYVTPPQSAGFSDHYDLHDVFVLQISGEKHWRIHSPVHALPLRDEPWTDHRAAVEAAASTPPLIEATLRPGDCLYLPRGYLHSATALGGVSTHLTLGVHAWTTRHVADALVEQAVRRASAGSVLRQSLPLGVDLGDAHDLSAATEAARAELVRAIEGLAADDLAQVLGIRARRSQRAAPVSPLAQTEAAARVGELGRVTLRPHLLARIRVGTDGVTRLVGRAAPVELDATEVLVVRRLLTQHDAHAQELGADLTRRLLLAGVVTPG
ncbi:MAG: cupin domain-containing protein [Actinomycetota bacterium]|nr:cupin domain-containing protein [Actinomycetota bacterium]